MDALEVSLSWEPHPGASVVPTGTSDTHHGLQPLLSTENPVLQTLLGRTVFPQGGWNLARTEGYSSLGFSPLLTCRLAKVNVGRVGDT